MKIKRNTQSSAPPKKMKSKSQTDCAESSVFLDLKKLIRFLKIDEEGQKQLLKNPSHPLQVPLRLAQKMQKNNLSDPLFLQFVPLKKELKKEKYFTQDPLQDSCFLKGRLMQKYQNRALLLCSESCAMHCRFCFRKNLNVSGFPKNDFSKELKLIEKNNQLSEIILSGGDPLACSNETLKKLLFALEKIAHVKRIRLHSRFLIGFPERLDAALLKIFAKLKNPLYFVFHINHPLEIDDAILKVFQKLRKTGIVLLNQAVLLKNINDNLPVLLELSEKLANSGVLFYYLHQLDQVLGAGHFLTPKKKGLELIKKLRSKTSGYAAPQYVQEIPFAESKTLLL